MMKDIVNAIAVRKVYSGTVKDMEVTAADILGFGAVAFLVDYDDKTLGATATVSFQECDTVGGTFEDVPEYNTIIPYKNETGELSASHPVDRFGYLGGKRYVKPVITASKNATTETVTIYAILGNPASTPTN